MDNNNKNKKNYPAIIILLLVAFVFLMYYMKIDIDNKKKYDASILAIQNMDYETAKENLIALEENKKYPDARTLLAYTELMQAEQKGKHITDLEVYADEIHFSYEGDLADEILEKTSEVHDSYIEYILERQKIVAEERKKRDKEMRASLANKLPYIGMPEEYIDATAAGHHKGFDSSISYDNGFTTYIHKFSWYSSNGRDIPLIVTCRNGKVSDVTRYYQNVYWTPAGMPNFGAVRKSPSSKKIYHDTYGDGYNDVYEDGDYDWDRYQQDDDYASGVDDAIEEWEEYGEDW